MRTLIVATMLFALAACEAPTAPTPATYNGNYAADDANTQADVNECPRRDGQPCK